MSVPVPYEQVQKALAVLGLPAKNLDELFVGRDLIEAWYHVPAEGNDNPIRLQIDRREPWARERA